MRLATLKIAQPRTPSERLDGRLAVVSADGRLAAPLPPDVYPNLLAALGDWERAEPRLRALAEALGAGRAPETVELAKAQLMAPLPRTWAWLDGSAYLRHVILVRRARGAELPRDLRETPLMYQGASDFFLGPNDDIPLLDEAHGLDFEAEVCVVLGETPLGASAADAARCVKLLAITNDVSLRNLIPREVGTGFGFLQSKPASSFAPFALTPDELGGAWRDGRLHLEMLSTYNGAPFGRPNAGEMHFSFHDLIAHAARTRRLSAGTILGGGTVSSEDEAAGSSCLAEKRMIETLQGGAPRTPFMKAGDTIEIEMLQDGRSVFGKISQRVVAAR